MSRERRRRQLVAGGVTATVSLVVFAAGGLVTAAWPSASGPVGAVSFGAFLVSLWFFLTVIAERDGPPSRPSAAVTSTVVPPIPATDPVWRIREEPFVPVLRPVGVDETLDLLLAHDRGENARGDEREIVVALSARDLVTMSSALRAVVANPHLDDTDRVIGVSSREALAWARRADRAARDAPAPGPLGVESVGVRRIGWTAWALEQDHPVGVGEAPDAWFVVPVDQLEFVTHAVRHVARTASPIGSRRVEVPELDETIVNEVAWRLTRVLRDARESDPRPVPALPVGRRVSPRPIRADVTWMLDATDVQTRLTPGWSYRPLVWLGSGRPDFDAGEATLDGVLVGAVCSWVGGDGSKDRVELRFWAEVDLGDLVTRGSPVTLLEGQRTVARGVVADDAT
jgi:hypothetical protein